MKCQIGAENKGFVVFTTLNSSYKGIGSNVNCAHHTLGLNVINSSRDVYASRTPKMIESSG